MTSRLQIWPPGVNLTSRVQICPLYDSNMTSRVQIRPLWFKYDLKSSNITIWFLSDLQSPNITSKIQIWPPGFKYDTLGSLNHLNGSNMSSLCPKMTSWVLNWPSGFLFDFFGNKMTSWPPGSRLIS